MLPRQSDRNGKIFHVLRRFRFVRRLDVVLRKGKAGLWVAHWVVANFAGAFENAPLELLALGLLELETLDRRFVDFADLLVHRLCQLFHVVQDRAVEEAEIGGGAALFQLVQLQNALCDQL